MGTGPEGKDPGGYQRLYQNFYQRLYQIFYQRLYQNFYQRLYQRLSLPIR